METKTKIYLMTLVLILFFAVSIFIVYYNQNFTETLTFDSFVKYENIQVDTINRTGQVYINYADSKIGHLKLENKGYFPQKYSIPILIGCLNFKSSSVKPIKFSIGQDYKNYYALSSQTDTLTIQIGETKDIDLYGYYKEGYSPITLLSSFSKENIKDVKIYRFNEKAVNPLDMQLRTYNYALDCEYLESNEEAIKTIAII